MCCLKSPPITSPNIACFYFTTQIPYIRMNIQVDLPPTKPFDSIVSVCIEEIECIYNDNKLKIYGSFFIVMVSVGFWYKFLILFLSCFSLFVSLSLFLSFSFSWPFSTECHLNILCERWNRYYKPLKSFDQMLNLSPLLPFLSDSFCFDTFYFSYFEKKNAIKLMIKTSSLNWLNLAHSIQMLNIVSVSMIIRHRSIFDMGINRSSQ